MLFNCGTNFWDIQAFDFGAFFYSERGQTQFSLIYQTQFALIH
jgi:hypothetical protein